LSAQGAWRLSDAGHHEHAEDIVRLEGKRAIITGAARGQGATEAERFIAEGATVLVTDVLDDRGQILAKGLGERAEYAHLDITSDEQWVTTVGEFVDKHGGLDVLVNNAGTFAMAPLFQMDSAEFRRVIEVNLTGTFLGMRAVLPVMLGQSAGSVINIGSIDGLVGMPGVSAYSASKHAVVGLTKSAALEVGGLGIRVNCVCPGGVDTEMFDLVPGEIDVAGIMASKVPLGRLAHSEEIAALVVYLASDESKYMTGSTLVIDGGMIAGISIGP
jgi:3alpha(or 20beta)-hydroxysteroid dehydrogenase